MLKMHATFLASIVLILSYGSEAHEADLNKERAFHHENATTQNNFHRECFLYQKPVDCADVFRLGFQRSGVYEIYPKSRILGTISIKVYCDMETDGGGWTVIQRRGDYKRPSDYFYKNWNEYKAGFGNLITDFWLGNDNIHALTNQKRYAVRFDLATDSQTAYALYNYFWIDNEQQKYQLHINGYSGNAGDSMTYHRGMKFSTKDVDNDLDSKNCAYWWKGGWWYRSCHSANLNGLYLKGLHNQMRYDIISWKDWKGYTVSLSNVEIKIRPQDF